MKTYVVGGAVRDRLLGLPVSDRDHVVIGATVDEMLAAGFKPVGRDFPVFLHPATHEEYALARTERKTAPGYSGFVFHADPSVTLEADLARRDLTVNAIAEDEATGTVTDPFDGRRDLAARVFRHVGPAFVEDPVRLLRVARFAARFADFTIAPETLALMREMADAGEVDALVPERVWQELSRGLMEAVPSRMLEVLRDTGALARLLPQIDPSASLRAALDRAARGDASLEVRFAVLLQGVEVADIEAICARFAIPRAARDLALLAARARGPLLDGDDPIGGVVSAMDRGDAYRRKARFVEAVEAIGWTLDDAVRGPFIDRMALAIDAGSRVDAGAIARDAAPDPARIAERVRVAREEAIRGALAGPP